MTVMRATMTSNRLDERWDALPCDPLRSVFNLYDSNHPLRFYIGRDAEQRRLLLLITPETPPKTHGMRSIKIQSLKRDDGKWALLLTLESLSLAPMFSLLCEDLIESSRDTGVPPDESLGFVLKRLGGWRKMLERGTPNLLSDNEVRGLCGELLFLQRLLGQLGKTEAVRAWCGPQRADQDFQTPVSAWEVKTIRPGADTIAVSSETQLQTLACPVHLVVFELAESESGPVGGFTLNSLVSDIRNALAEDYDAGERFDAQLITAGYLPRHEYNMPSLAVLSMSLFLVETNFPRITPDMLSPGIRRVSYDIHIPECEDFRITSSPLFYK